MKTQARFTGLAAAALVGLVAAAAHAQPTTVPADGVSDLGSFEQVPYRLEPQIMLRAEDKLQLRKLEDRHIQELRAMEDRFEKDLRTLRTKQQSERESMLKSFARR